MSGTTNAVQISGPGGLTSDLDFDASVSNAPSGFETTIEDVAVLYLSNYNFAGSVPVPTLPRSPALSLATRSALADARPNGRRQLGRPNGLH